MNFEKFANSKFYLIFDWIWKLFVLNTLTLVTSLGVVTLFPSIISCMQSIKDYKDGSGTGIYTTYFRNFRKVFKSTVWVGITLLVIFAILLFAANYYSTLIKDDQFSLDTLGIFVFIGFYIVGFLALVMIMVTNQLPMIYLYFHFRYIDYFKFAFFMAFKFIFQSLLILGIWALNIFILYLTPLWFGLMVSVPLYLTFIITKPVYWYLTKPSVE